MASPEKGYLVPVNDDFSVPPDRPVEKDGGGGNDDGMRERLAKLEAVLPTLASKADVEGVRADIHKMDASITRWMIATIIALFLGFAGLFFTMSNSISGSLERATKANSSPSVPTPIVIQIPAQPPDPVQPPSPQARH